MKKLLALILIVTLAAFTLFSCDKKKNDEEDTDEDTDILTPILPPDDEEPEEDVDLDGVDDEYMPDDGWTFS